MLRPHCQKKAFADILSERLRQRPAASFFSLG
jgi:hypothetical protein